MTKLNLLGKKWGRKRKEVSLIGKGVNSIVKWGNLPKITDRLNNPKEKYSFPLMNNVNITLQNNRNLFFKNKFHKRIITHQTNNERLSKIFS